MSGSTVDFAALTPDQLRQEADRRELLERAKGLAERHDARLRLVEVLRSLDGDLVADAHALDAIRLAVGRIVSADKAEKEITNGDVSLASRGAPEHWWRDATASHPKRKHPDLLDDIAAGRKTVMGQVIS